MCRLLNFNYWTLNVQCLMFIVQCFNVPMDSIRLQKYIADHGLCSRRQAEDLIRDGLVVLNGTTATLGQKVRPGQDHVSVNGKKIHPRAVESVVLAMNKPKGVICSNRDPHHSQTIFDLLPAKYAKHRLFCVGRLDKDSEGLILITNNGELSNAIIHPSKGIVKRYHVTLNKAFDTALIPKLLQGVKKEGEHLHAKKIIMTTRGPDCDRRLEVHLEQGRKREIRRLFESFGFYVKRLQRFQIGQLILKRLPPGEVRELNNEDLDSLLHN